MSETVPEPEQPKEDRSDYDPEKVKQVIREVAIYEGRLRASEITFINSLVEKLDKNEVVTREEFVRLTFIVRKVRR